MNNNHRGFSIIELIFAMGIMAITLLIVGTNLLQIQKYYHYREAVERFSNEMDLLQIGLTKKCASMVKNYLYNPTNTSSPQIVTGLNTTEGSTRDIQIFWNGITLKGKIGSTVFSKPSKLGDLQIDKVQIQFNEFKAYNYAIGADLVVEASIPKPEDDSNPGWQTYSGESSLKRVFPIVISIAGFIPGSGSVNNGQLNQCALSGSSEADIISFSGNLIDQKQVSAAFAKLLCDKMIPGVTAHNGLPAGPGGLGSGGLRCAYAASKFIDE